MTIDFIGHRILLDNEIIYLTTTQNDILKLLYDKKGEVVTYEEVSRNIYDLDCDDIIKTTIKKHISLLKKKVRQYIKIKTIRSVGYIIEETQSDFAFNNSQDDIILPF